MLHQLTDRLVDLIDKLSYYHKPSGEAGMNKVLENDNKNIIQAQCP